jgi:hypothetical protein
MREPARKYNLYVLEGEWHSPRQETSGRDEWHSPPDSINGYLINPQIPRVLEKFVIAGLLEKYTDANIKKMTIAIL